jgi:nucleotide-binding universal stress UspA family protein
MRTLPDGGVLMNNEIVVGLDESPSSKAALNWASEQANSLHAVLRAVHVLDWPNGLSSVGFPAPVNFMDVSREELQKSYRQERPIPTGSCSSRAGMPGESWFGSLETHAYSSWALANTSAWDGC